MGYYGFLEKKIKAQNLRRKGLSYSEIQNIIDIPKSTLSGWCRDVFLSEKQLNRILGNKLKGAAKGRIIGAKKQQKKRLDQTRKMLMDGKNEVGFLSKRDRFLAGIALYVAEGTKKDKVCCFANSDPILIKFMASWFREFCKTSEDKLRGAIWLHKELNERKAKEYWSNLTKIPVSQFHKTYIAENKTKSRKIRKNLHQYGVFSIRFSDAKTHRKIMGWIAGVFR